MLLAARAEKALAWAFDRAKPDLVRLLADVRATKAYKDSPGWLKNDRLEEAWLAWATIFWANVTDLLVMSQGAGAVFASRLVVSELRDRTRRMTLDVLGLPCEADVTPHTDFTREHPLRYEAAIKREALPPLCESVNARKRLTMEVME